MRKVEAIYLWNKSKGCFLQTMEWIKYYLEKKVTFLKLFFTFLKLFLFYGVFSLCQLFNFWCTSELQNIRDERECIWRSWKRFWTECCLLGGFSFIFTVEACRFYDANSSTCTCNAKPGMWACMLALFFLPSYPTYVLTVTRLIFRCGRFFGALSALYEFLYYIATNFLLTWTRDFFKKSTPNGALF